MRCSILYPITMALTPMPQALTLRGRAAQPCKRPATTMIPRAVKLLMLGLLVSVQAAATLAQSSDPAQELIQIERQIAAKLAELRTLLNYQDAADRLSVERGYLSATQADERLQAYGERLYRSEVDASTLAALRAQLDGEAQKYFSAIEQAIVTAPRWPETGPVQGWRQKAQTELVGVRKELPTLLGTGADPTPVLERAARVAGWTRGEASAVSAFSGHDRRVSSALPATSAERERLFGAPGTVSSPPPMIGEQTLHFDDLPAGVLPADTFRSVGMNIASGAAAGIHASVPGMVLPAGRKQVLLVAGGPTTSLTMAFDVPIKRFGLTRIGTAGGASVPTWKLEAFDSTGSLVGVTGEEHDLPLTPRQFSIAGNGIVRVVLSTDNRWGEGTWATWNSLPVAELAFQY